MQIRMQSQDAQIAIQSRPASQSIQQPGADLQIRQPEAEMRIRTTSGKLTIDQSQAWEEMDIKSIFTRTRENAQRAKQLLLKGIARVSSEGDEMADLRTGRNAYIEQARRRGNPPPADFNIAWIPSPLAVKTHYTPGTTDIQFQANKPVINAQTRKPIISNQQGDVHISLKQRNSLKIDFVK